MRSGIAAYIIFVSLLLPRGGHDTYRVLYIDSLIVLFWFYDVIELVLMLLY